VPFACSGKGNGFERPQFDKLYGDEKTIKNSAASLRVLLRDKLKENILIM